MNIDTLKATRKLDALVAERVMGMDLESMPESGDQWTKRVTGEPGIYKTTFSPIPAYSTDIFAAWQVVEKMKEKGFRLIMTVWPKCSHNLEDECGFSGVNRQGNYKPYYAHAPTIPHAICRAALKAVQ